MYADILLRRLRSISLWFSLDPPWEDWTGEEEPPVELLGTDDTNPVEGEGQESILSDVIGCLFKSRLFILKNNCSIVKVCSIRVLNLIAINCGLR